MNCANFLEYNPKIYIIFWNTIHKIHAFCDYIYQNQTELYKLENIDVHIYVCNLSQSIPVSRRGGAVCPMMCYTLAAMSMPWTSLLGAGAINTIMRTMIHVLEV